jgi:hypothetical protein
MPAVSKPVKLSKGDDTRADVQGVNQPKTNHGAMAFFKRGGTMATKGVNPFAKFEKSSKDTEKKGMKEGSKKEMMMDKAQMMGMKKGGGVKKMASGGSASARADGIASKGKTKGKMISM